MVFKKSIRKDIRESAQKIQWKCIESRIESKCLHYGRFIISSLNRGQADIIGIAMRRVLLEEIKAPHFTRLLFKNVRIAHEYGRIVGIDEDIQEIVSNLQKIVLRGFATKILKASICVRSGPTPIFVTAKDINLPPSVQIVDEDQHLFTIRDKPMDFSMELRIERGCRKSRRRNTTPQDGRYPIDIDSVLMPVRNVNYTIHSFGDENGNEDILFLEIWTNGSLTPREALREASMTLIGLFISPFLHSEAEGIHLKEKKNTCTSSPFTLESETSELELPEIVKKYKKDIKKQIKELNELKKKKKETVVPWDHVFIDQAALSSRTYKCLKKANINTVLDILEEFSSNCPNIRNFGIEEMSETALKVMTLTDILISWYRELPNK